MQTEKTKTQQSQAQDRRAILVLLSTEAAEALDDLQYYERKRLRRRVTKRELVERAVLALAAESPKG